VRLVISHTSIQDIWKNQYPAWASSPVGVGRSDYKLCEFNDTEALMYYVGRANKYRREHAASAVHLSAEWSTAD